MNRRQFDHVVRAAGAVLDSADVLVIGSQALHGSLPTLLPEALRSIEVDVAAIGGDEEDADLIDGSLGELSMFHERFGYHAHGATESTAVLPADWKSRLVVYESQATNGVRAHCLEPHDLWIAKAVAGRDKDRDFCHALRRSGLVKREVLRERLATVDPIHQDVRTRVAALIEGNKPRKRKSTGPGPR